MSRFLTLQPLCRIAWLSCTSLHLMSSCTVGNWSIDSACHSMHSDQVTVLLPPGDGSDRQAIRRSLDKDSAISDVNQSDRLVFTVFTICVYVCMPGCDLPGGCTSRPCISTL